MNSSRRLTRSDLVVETLERMVLLSAGVTDLEAVHVDGQTFLTWQEDTTIIGEEYHVYRHTEAITQDNIDQAELITGRWGPLDDQTSLHRLAGKGAPQNFVIEDLGPALSDDTGLFVYTTQNGEQGDAFYAVTLVVNGVEQRVGDFGDTTDVVREVVGDGAPILVTSVNDGKGRVYTHFMDYKSWNPSFQGYAYNYAVALPFDYDPSQEYALRVELHAYTEGHKFVSEAEYDWQTIQLFVDDPGADRGSLHTWWYGFAADHDYNSDGPVPSSGVIRNFTEQRVLQAIDEVIADSQISVDTSRIHAFGHSMGGSGALSLGIRYGDVFAAVYSSQGMTNYREAPSGFDAEFEQLWGLQDSNLLIVNGGPHSSTIAEYNAEGDNATGVWDWMDHGQQLVRRRGEHMSLLMFGHGKADDTIIWATQGQPFLASVNAANVAFTSEQRGGWGHNWMGFDFMVDTLFSDSSGDLSTWHFSSDTSYISITNATNSGPDVPTRQGTDTYNLSIDWSTSWNPFDRDVVDTADRYEISIRSLSGPQTADITPRNLQRFQVQAGTVIEWTNADNDSGEILQQGVVVADADGLITLSNVDIGTGTGSRLSLTLSSAPGPLPGLSIDDAVVLEGDSGNQSVQVIARLDRVAEQDVTFRFATQDGTATSGLDFVAASGAVTIAAGSDSAEINLEVIGEALLEADETFSISLSDVANGQLRDSEATVLIVNDDVPDPEPEPEPEPPQTTVRLEALKDAVITSTENPNANLGAADTLGLYVSGGDQRKALLQFDVSDVNLAAAQRAVVQLKQINGPYDDEPLQISVYAIAAPWDEGTGDNPWSSASTGVTWRSSASGSAWATPGGDLHTTLDFGNGPNGLISSTLLNGYDAANDLVELDVTALVNAWLDGSLQNHGLAIVVTQGQYTEYLFASSEHQNAENRPQLIIQSRQ